MCPFCGVSSELDGQADHAALARPLSRAAVVFASATALAACVGGPGDLSSSSGSSGGSSSSTSSSGSSGDQSSSSGTSGDPEPVPVPVYGPAPVNDGG